MEFMSAPWWSALLAIILIDLVLAGDNAIVIALAARNLPPAPAEEGHHLGHRRRHRRALRDDRSAWSGCCKIPGLMLVGGLGLLWIAYKLLADQDGARRTRRRSPPPSGAR